MKNQRSMNECLPAALVSVLGLVFSSCSTAPSQAPESKTERAAPFNQPVIQTNTGPVETVSGVWLFEEEQIEIRISRVDEGAAFSGPRSNATRFTILSNNEKVALYKTQRINLDPLGLSKVSANTINTFLQQPIEAENEKVEQTTFSGSIELRAGSPVDITLQNLDVNRDTQAVYSRLRLTLTDQKSSQSSQSANYQPTTTIVCGSYPSFVCAKAGTEQSASLSPR